MCACAERALRTWAGVTDVARRAAVVRGCESAIDPNATGFDAPLVTALLKALGGVPAHRNNKQNINTCKELLRGVKSVPALFAGNANAMAEVVALRRAEIAPDFGLHVFKGLASDLFDEIAARLSVDDRDAFASRIAALHTGGAEGGKSGFHRRVELWSLGVLLEGLTLPAELRKAAECFARATKWALRTPHATWHAYRSKCVLRGAALIFEFAAQLSLVINLHGKNGRVRTIYQMQYHLMVSHAVEWLKVANPQDIMCEWEERCSGGPCAGSPCRRATNGTGTRA